MSSSLNLVIIMGNLTRDVELRHTPQGSPVTEVSVAINRRNGNRDEVCFVDVVIWGKLAENCAKYLGKGSGILVEGYLKQETWTDRNGGGTRSKLRIVAEKIQFMGQNKGGGYKSRAQKQDQGVPPEYAPELPAIPEPSEHDVSKSNGYQPQPEYQESPEPPNNWPDSGQIDGDIPF